MIHYQLVFFFFTVRNRFDHQMYNFRPCDYEFQSDKVAFTKFNKRNLATFQTYSTFNLKKINLRNQASIQSHQRKVEFDSLDPYFMVSMVQKILFCYDWTFSFTRRCDVIGLHKFPFKDNCLLINYLVFFFFFLFFEKQFACKVVRYYFSALPLYFFFGNMKNRNIFDYDVLKNYFHITHFKKPIPKIHI